MVRIKEKREGRQGKIWRKGMQWAAMLATSMAKWGDTPAYPSAQGTSLKRYEEELDRSKFHLLNCYCCCSLITKSCLILCNPTDGNPPLSMGFSRREYWSGLPFPSPGDLSDPGTEPTSPELAGRFFTTEPPGKPIYWILTSNRSWYLYCLKGNTVQELPKLTIVSNTFLNRLHYPVS